MKLFLDTVSPSPEFTVIKDNKIIQSIQILNRKSNKISECIIPAFLELQKKVLLEKKIKKLIICTGPGSYTALRVGVAFMYGLSFSKKIPLIGISCPTILQFGIPKSNQKKTLILINSSNNQNFVCTLTNKNDKFLIKKISDKLLLTKNDYFKYDYSISNDILSSNIIEKFSLRNHKVVNFKEIIISNLKLLKSFQINNVIEPIYISDNKILN